MLNLITYFDLKKIESGKWWGMSYERGQIRSHVNNVFISVVSWFIHERTTHIYNAMNITNWQCHYAMLHFLWCPSSSICRGQTTIKFYGSINKAKRYAASAQYTKTTIYPAGSLLANLFERVISIPLIIHIFSTFSPTYFLVIINNTIHHPHTPTTQLNLVQLPFFSILDFESKMKSAFVALLLVSLILSSSMFEVSMAGSGMSS